MGLSSGRSPRRLQTFLVLSSSYLVHRSHARRLSEEARGEQDLDRVSGMSRKPSCTGVSDLLVEKDFGFEGDQIFDVNNKQQ